MQARCTRLLAFSLPSCCYAAKYLLSQRKDALAEGWQHQPHMACRDIVLVGIPLLEWDPLNGPLNGYILASSSHNIRLHLVTNY